LLAGPPIVNVGPLAYGQSNNLGVIGSNTSSCWKIRVGGLTENDFGPGMLRVDFRCAAPQNSSTDSWDGSSGRCCIWDAVHHVTNCQIAPFTDLAATLQPPCCIRLGGYFRNTTDFYEAG